MLVQSCGNSLNWWTKRILGKELACVDQLTEGAQHTEGLLFYPHLTGDKSLYNDPDLTGAFIGLRAGTSIDDMTLAVLEGTAFGLRQLYEKLKTNTSDTSALLVIGGGAQNEKWMQIIADVLHVTTVQLNHKVSAAYGIALMTIKALEGEKTCIKAMAVETVKRYMPCREKAKAYDEKYQKYLKIHQAIKSIYA